jgi:hypothetical protein
MRLDEISGEMVSVSDLSMCSMRILPPLAQPVFHHRAYNVGMDVLVDVYLTGNPRRGLDSYRS